MLNKIIIIALLILIGLLVKLINNKKDNFTEIELSQNLSQVDIQDLKKGQVIMTNMLREFDKICRDNNLKYWCIGGTLIGAIRHNGWVPWDGDVDIGMLDEDYNKFKKIIGKHKLINMEFSEPKDKPCSKLRSKKAKYIYTEWGNNWDQDKGIQIDIFIFKTNNIDIYGNSAICGRPDKKKRKYNEIFPLKELKFNNFDVYVPNKYKEISKEIWGGHPPTMPEISKRYPHEGRIKLID